MRVPAIALAAVLVAIGCQQQPSSQRADSDSAAVRTDSAPAMATTTQKTTYSCADGSTVEAWYPTTDSARIVHDGRTTEMAIAISASGARYVGGGWEWWTKGMTEGTLSPLGPGEDVASAPGVSCTAQ